MRMEAGVSKKNTLVLPAGGFLTMFPDRLQCGEILSQDMVSFLYTLS